MKIFLTIATIFLLVFVSKTYAQGDFAPIGAKWHYSLLINLGEPINTRRVGYKIQESIKDTVFEGQLCRKLETRLYSRLYNATGPLEISAPVVSYVYSNTDTVFYYNEELGRFLHLYVFNVNVGDTVYYRTPPMYQWNGPNDTLFRMKITEVGSMNINGTLLRKINHEPIDYIRLNTYTEKIGVLKEELFGLTLNQVAIFINPYARCYMDNEVVYRRDVDVPCEFVDGPTNLANTPEDKDAILVFPNPASNQIQVRLKEYSNLNIQSLEIYDLMGRKVEQIKVNKSVGIIDISRLPKGVYWLKVLVQNSVYTQKLIIN